MTDVERLILRGLSIIIRTQMFPKNEEATKVHINQLLTDADWWTKEFGRLAHDDEIVRQM